MNSSVSSKTSAVHREDATNAQRLRHARIFTMLKKEMDKRFKAQNNERDTPGRGP